MQGIAAVSGIWGEEALTRVVAVRLNSVSNGLEHSVLSLNEVRIE